jgi:pimeloyl-ACP methyl ester carboxylesterase
MSNRHFDSDPPAGRAWRFCRLTAWLALAVLVLACLVAAAAESAGRPPWLTVVEDCLTPAEKKRVLGLRASDGTRLAAVVLGRGSTGVVLVHGSRSDFCEWMWYARKLARSHRVAAIDLRGSGSSYPAPREGDVARYERDVLAAVAELRRRGSSRIFTMGSSLGAGVVLVAAPLLQGRGLAGVVSLSAPASTAPQYDTIGAVRRARVPVLFLAARRDRSFAADARLLYRAARSRHKRLRVIAGAAHGSGLLAERVAAAAVASFLAAPRMPRR